MKTNWDKIEGKCACTLEELERAEKLATRMMRQVGGRHHVSEERAAWIDRRDRAFSVLVLHYEAVRRAIVYLRWDAGDADIVAPSLYAGRRRKASKTEEPAEVPAQQVEQAAVLPQPDAQVVDEPERSAGRRVNGTAWTRRRRPSSRRQGAKRVIILTRPATRAGHGPEHRSAASVRGPSCLSTATAESCRPLRAGRE